MFWYGLVVEREYSWFCCDFGDWVRMERLPEGADDGLGGDAEETGFTLRWYWSH